MLPERYRYVAAEGLIGVGQAGLACLLQRIRDMRSAREFFSMGA